MEQGQILKIEKEDIPMLLPFAESVFYDTFFHLNEKKDYDDYVKKAFTHSQFEQEIDNVHSHFYWIMHDHRPAAWLKLNERQAFTEDIEGHGIEIQRIYVGQNLQGFGYGKRLMQFAEKFAKEKNAPFIWLGVWEKNNKAIDFYKSQGFRITSSHDFIFGDEHQTDYIMTKSFLDQH